MDASDRVTCEPLNHLRSVVTAALASLLIVACSKAPQAPLLGTDSQAATGQAGAEPTSEAPAVTQGSWMPEALQQLVAPIALYPDQLLGQILAASVNSQEVLDGGNWLLQNQDLKGEQLDTAAEKAGFGPAMRALVQFPSVVDMMCQQIDWTRQLGAAFTSDQARVLDAVQQLRAQAQKVGNLTSTPQQKVETKTESGKTIIEVQPAEPTVIYVPQYNPTVVYTTPPPPAPPPPPGGTVSTGAAVAGGLLAFGVGVMIGSAISNDNCYPHWGAGAVYVGPRPFYPPAYVYRPAYGPAFRPAYGYASPPGYRYSYNNVNVNRNVNVNVNNNSYFNQFNHNQNLRVSNTQNMSGAPQRNPGQNQSTWKGQSSYAGANSSTASGRTNSGPGSPASPPGQKDNSPSRNSPSATRPGGAGAAAPPTRTAQNRAGDSAAANRPAQPSSQGGDRSGVDRGFSGSNRPEGNTGPGTSQNPAGRAGGSAAVGRSGSAASTGRGGREDAFSGATQSSGGFDRSASARGHASAGGRQVTGGHGGRR